MTTTTTAMMIAAMIGAGVLLPLSVYLCEIIVDEIMIAARMARAAWPIMARQIDIMIWRARLAIFRSIYVDGPVYAAAFIARRLARDERGNLDTSRMIGTVYRWSRVMLVDRNDGVDATLTVLPDIMFFGAVKFIGNLIKTFGAIEPYFRAMNWLASPWPFRSDWGSTIKGARQGTPAAVNTLVDRINGKPWNIQVSVDDDGSIDVTVSWSRLAYDRLGADRVKFLTFALIMRATNNKARSAFSDLAPADIDAIVYDCAMERWNKTGRSEHTTCCVRSNNARFKGTLLRQLGSKGGQWGRISRTLICEDEHNRDHYSGADDRAALMPGYGAFRKVRNTYLYDSGKALDIPAALQLTRDDIERYHDRRAKMLETM